MSSPMRNYNYGTLPTHEDENKEKQEEDLEIAITPPRSNYSSSALDHASKRWSVGNKIKSRYYCRLRSCDDCFKILSMKCILATAMLITFTILALQAFNYFLFSQTDLALSNEGSDIFDYS